MSTLHKVDKTQIKPNGINSPAVTAPSHVPFTLQTKQQFNGKFLEISSRRVKIWKNLIKIMEFSRIFFEFSL